MGEEEELYLTLHCHLQDDFCSITDSSVSHFNALSVACEDRVTVSINRDFRRERRVSDLRSCVEVDVDVLGSPSLIVHTVSVDVNSIELKIKESPSRIEQRPPLLTSLTHYRWAKPTHWFSSPSSSVLLYVHRDNTDY